MPNKCSCGGRYVPAWYYVEDCATKERFAIAICDRCQRTIRQRKRESAARKAYVARLLAGRERGERGERGEYASMNA